MNADVLTTLLFLITQTIVFVLSLVFWYGCVDAKNANGNFGGAFIPISFLIFSFIPILGLFIQAIITGLMLAELATDDLKLKHNKLTKFLFNVKEK